MRVVTGAMRRSLARGENSLSRPCPAQSAQKLMSSDALIARQAIMIQSAQLISNATTKGSLELLWTR